MAESCGTCKHWDAGKAFTENVKGDWRECLNDDVGALTRPMAEGGGFGRISGVATLTDFVCGFHEPRANG